MIPLEQVFNVQNVSFIAQILAGGQKQKRSLPL
jgi:hypothetical protein